MGPRARTGGHGPAQRPIRPAAGANCNGNIERSINGRAPVEPPIRELKGKKPHRSGVIMPKLWMFDFDNTVAPLEPAVDWAGSRRELQAWLRAQGVADALFEEFPRGNLVLYEALRARLCAGGDAARAVLAGGGCALR